jgi:hypothetical protein
VKKAVSIFLILLLLFNALGFYGLLQGLRYKSALDLVNRLDNDQYAREETITIKVPFTMPYQLNTKGYERVDGEIEYDGKFYRLVEQKLENDTLSIVCIRDLAASRIHEALEGYVKTLAPEPVNAKNTSKASINFIKDFLPTSISVSHLSDGWNYSVSPQPQADHFFNRSLVIITPPPRS